MATFAASREIERTAAAVKSGSKAWAWTGIVTFIVGFFVTWSVQLAISEDTLTTSGQPLLDKLNEDGIQALWRVTSGLGYLTVAGLTFFGVGLWKHLQAKSGGNSILPTVILGSFLVTAASLAIAMSFRAQVMDGLAYYDADPATHVMMNRLQQDSVLTAWAAMLAGATAVTIGGLKGTLFPKGLGWFSLVVVVLMSALCLAGVAFPANIPALLWVLVMSIWSVRQPSVE